MNLERVSDLGNNADMDGPGTAGIASEKPLRRHCDTPERGHVKL